MSLSFPAGPETDMREAHAAPDKEIRQAREGEQPCEEGITNVCLIDEGKQTKRKLYNDTPERSALLVNICEEMRAHTPHRERLHRTRGTVGTGIRNRKHRNGDDCVEDRRKTFDVCSLDGQDEG